MLKLAKVGPFKGSISKVVDFEQSLVLTGDKGDMHMMSSLSFESAHPFHLLSFHLPKLENPHSLAQCRSLHGFMYFRLNARIFSCNMECTWVLRYSLRVVVLGVLHDYW